MTDDQYTIRFECKTCGPTLLVLSDGETDDSIASCKSCGQVFGRFADVKAKAIDAVRDDAIERIKRMFKGK